MNIPIRRRDDGRRSGQEFERLRPAFASEPDAWPDFVRAIDRTLHEVSPLADIEETDDSYLLDDELPGVRRENIDLLVDQGRLVVTGERHDVSESACCATAPAPSAGTCWPSPCLVRSTVTA